MMNKWFVSGNLTDEPTFVGESNGKKAYTYGTIGVYNGKDEDGKSTSMFINFVVFGKDAEIVRDLAHKGDRLLLSGALSEATSVSKTNGKTYVNKKITCDTASVLAKQSNEEKVSNGGW